MGCTPSILSDTNRNRKDSGLFCVNIRGNRTASCDNGTNRPELNDATNNTICQQILVSPYQSGIKDCGGVACVVGSASEKLQAFVKKDSIVSVSGIGHLTTYTSVQAIGRRTTGSSVASSASGRLGHRKSSLALTPEEEPIDGAFVKLNALEFKYPQLLPPNPQIKALLVFSRTDSMYDTVLSACQRLNYDTTVSKSVQAGIDEFNHATNGHHHLIVVDARSAKLLDAELFASSIRNVKGSLHTTLVAVVKKSIFDKDDAVLAFLDGGFSKCLVETQSSSLCCAELKQIQQSIVRPQYVLATQQALYAGLHRAKQPIFITDNYLRTQFSNKAAERLFGLKMDEIIGRSMVDVFASEIGSILVQTNRNREFDGIVNVRRKSETVSVHVRATPVTCIGIMPTHIVITMELSHLTGDSATQLPLAQTKEAPRGSLHSIRRGSFDIRSIGSDGLRRTSLAKLSTLPLEAPITKIVALLSQVQESCSPDEVKLLDKVMDFLKREGLYSPQLKEMRTDDPVASDLIGALLMQGGSNILSSRRSSNDSVIRIGRPASVNINNIKMKSSGQITTLLEQSLNWDFNIFRLEEITENRPLLYLGFELSQRFDVLQTLNIDETTYKAWLIVIEANYHSTNSYHNSCHAADVMQATAAFLRQLSQKEYKMLDHMDEACALIAAATHDIDHPGRSSAFLCNSDNTLALLYNDLCVLESHHAATTFRITLRDDKINIFKNLDRDSFKIIRSIIIDMILATEMTKHFEHLTKFVSVFGAEIETASEFAQLDTDDNQMLIRRMLIKCADVSNPARPLYYCVEWARRIAEEYFTQTDEEKTRNLPIVMPMFDRSTCSISKSQIGFIEYIIQDMMHAWENFIDMPEIIQYMQFNYAQWKLFEEQGIHTLHDIKNKQIALTSTRESNAATVMATANVTTTVTAPAPTPSATVSATPNSATLSK